MSQVPASRASFRASRDGRRPIHVSFEFFPPKTAEMEATLWSSIERLTQAVETHTHGHRGDDFALLHHREQPLRRRFEALFFAP